MGEEKPSRPAAEEAAALEPSRQETAAGAQPAAAPASDSMLSAPSHGSPAPGSVPSTQSNDTSARTGDTEEDIMPSEEDTVKKHTDPATGNATPDADITDADLTTAEPNAPVASEEASSPAKEAASAASPEEGAGETASHAGQSAGHDDTTQVTDSTAAGDAHEGHEPPSDALPPAPPEDEHSASNAPMDALIASSGGALQHTTPEEEPAPEPRAMTLLDHLNELRIRLVRCLIAVAVAFTLCYSFAEKLFDLLMQPLVKAMPPDSKLIFTALPEAFFVYMQVGLVAATFVASPYIFFQIWAFISPGLYDEEKKSAIPVAICSAAFFIGGAAFCYFQVFPYAFEFFMGFATDRILPMPSLSEYLGFALKMLLAFGLIFEMPLFAFFLAKIGLVTAGMMRRGRKYAILAIFIVAAILTPPDVFSQTLMACPMLVLYEISILIAAAVGRKDKKEEEEEGEAAEGPLNAERPEQGH